MKWAFLFTGGLLMLAMSVENRLLLAPGSLLIFWATIHGSREKDALKRKLTVSHYLGVLIAMGAIIGSLVYKVHTGHDIGDGAEKLIEQRTVYIPFFVCIWLLGMVVAGRRWKLSNKENEKHA